MSVYLIDQYQNAIQNSGATPKVKRVQLQEPFTLMTYDSIGRLKTLCMSILSLSGGVESELKRCSSPFSVKKKTKTKTKKNKQTKKTNNNNNA